MEDFGFIKADMDLMAKGGGDNPRKLLLRTCFLLGFLAALVTNDASVSALTHPLIDQCVKMGVNPGPLFLVALACSSNIGSSLALIGNPQNIIIMNFFRIVAAALVKNFKLWASPSFGPAPVLHGGDFMEYLSTSSGACIVGVVGGGRCACQGGSRFRGGKGASSFLGTCCLGDLSLSHGGWPNNSVATTRDCATRM